MPVGTAVDRLCVSHTPVRRLFSRSGSGKVRSAADRNEPAQCDPADQRPQCEAAFSPK